MAKLRLMHAINQALFEEMERDPRVILFGQDVEISMFGDTKGLRERFGPERVRDTPICEGILTQMAVGAAASGSRVILHMFLANFLYTGYDGIANQASKLRLMTGGQVRLPVTFVVGYGGGRALGAQHSETPFGPLMNLSGINVITPATPADARGLLKTAIRGDNPSIFLEPGGRGGEFGEVPENDETVPLGKAVIVREGSDVTIVAIGGMLRHAHKAAENLSLRYGISAEIVDPRTIVPLDEATILTSLGKTGRLVVVDESRDRASAASHIAAIACDRGFLHLRAPVKRVTVANTGLPYSPAVEPHMIPNAGRIESTVVDLLASSASKL